MRISFLAAIAAALLLGGCATTLKVPKDGPTATITTEKGYGSGVGFGRAASAVYSMFVSPDCQKQISTYMTWTSPAEVSKPIIAGRKVAIVAQTNYLWSTGGGMASKTCITMVSFTPRQGGRYKVVNQAKSDGCRLLVTDIATGRPPSDFRAFWEEDPCFAFRQAAPSGPQQPLAPKPGIEI